MGSALLFVPNHLRCIEAIRMLIGINSFEVDKIVEQQREASSKDLFSDRFETLLASSCQRPARYGIVGHRIQRLESAAR